MDQFTISLGEKSSLFYSRPICIHQYFKSSTNMLDLDVRKTCLCVYKLVCFFPLIQNKYPSFRQEFVLVSLLVTGKQMTGHKGYYSHAF